MEVISTIQSILAITITTLCGALAIFMGYAIVHLTCNNEEEEEETK